VMKHGCMVMTLRLSSSHRSGSCQIHSGRKKRVKFAAMSSPCWSFLSTSKASSKRNLYPLVKLSIASFTVRFWSGWGRAFGANVQTSGTNNWFLHHDNVPAHTLLAVQQFLTSKNITVIPHPTPPFTWPHPLRHFPIPQDKITVERASFWHDWGYPRRNVRGYEHTHIWELPGMH
jgi:hypothetical protein